ncbi:aromatic ring-hydroxylating oxygenase subunit alpha [Sphingomonas oryzagri]
MTRLIRRDVSRRPELDPRDAALLDKSAIGLTADWEHAVAMAPGLYTDRKFAAVEAERIFRRHWICVGHVSQVSEPGDFFTTMLVGEPLIITRTAEEKIVGISAVCSHRGAILADGCGSTSRFQCPYHRWAYNLSGELVGLPFMEHIELPSPHLDLRRYRVDTWLGWIMVNLDGDAAPLASTLPHVEKEIAPWDVGKMVPLCEPVIFHGEYNWKIVCDNQGESYHLIGPHARSVLPHVSPRDSEFYTDGTTFVRSEFATRSAAIGPVFDGPRLRLPSRFSGSWSYNILPNHIFVLTDDFVVWQLQKIDDIGKITLELHVLGHPEWQTGANFDNKIKSVRDGVILVENEDQSSFRSVWAGLLSGQARSAPFASSELGTLYWQRWYVREMQNDRQI